MTPAHDAEWEELDPDCGLVGFHEVLGLKVTGWSPGRVRIEFDVVQNQRNMNGLLHGGVAMSALDTAMGLAAFHRGPEKQRRVGATVSLTTQFQKSVSGGHLTVIGRVTGGGSKTFFVAGEVLDEEGDVCFTGSGVFKAFTNPTD